MGVQRTSEPLGVHPASCKRKACHGARLVTRRRWAFVLAGVPLVAFDARWRRCVTCKRGAGTPRFTIPTAITATLLAALAVGQGWLAPLHPVAWALPVLLWTLWGLAGPLDRMLDARLLPLPSKRPRRAQTARQLKRAQRQQATRRTTHGATPGAAGSSPSAPARMVNSALRTITKLRRARESR